MEDANRDVLTEPLTFETKADLAVPSTALKIAVEVSTFSFVISHFPRTDFKSVCSVEQRHQN